MGGVVLFIADAIIRGKRAHMHGAQLTLYTIGKIEALVQQGVDVNKILGGSTSQGIGEGGKPAQPLPAPDSPEPMGADGTYIPDATPEEQYSPAPWNAGTAPAAMPMSVPVEPSGTPAPPAIPGRPEVGDVDYEPAEIHDIEHPDLYPDPGQADTYADPGEMANEDAGRAPGQSGALTTWEQPD